MRRQIVVLDSSIPIDFFRKQNKLATRWAFLKQNYSEFCISSVAIFEVLKGAKPEHEPFWMEFFKPISVLPFDLTAVRAAVKIDAELKRKSLQIDLADLMIAATALVNKFPLATLNRNHFERVEGLEVD